MGLALTVGIISFVIIMAFIITSKFKNELSLVNAISFSVMGLMLSLFGGFVVSGFLSPFILEGGNYEMIEKAYDRKEIIALSNSNDLSGNFFLGIGSSNKGIQYYFMEKSEDKGYKLNSINANDVTINESSKEGPNITKLKKVIKNEKDRFWIGLGTENDLETVITVPEGSIKRDFNLELEEN